MLSNIKRQVISFPYHYVPPLHFAGGISAQTTKHIYPDPNLQTKVTNGRILTSLNSLHRTDANFLQTKIENPKYGGCFSWPM